VEPAVAVDASSRVLTRVVVQALVDVDGAVGSGKAAALANRAGGALFAESTVLARVGVAETSVVAPLAAQLGRALAMVVVT